MAYFSTTEPKVRKELGKEITKAAFEESKWAQFIGTGENAIIKSQRENSVNGGSVTMRMRGLLRGSGVKDGEKFSANMDEIKYLSQTVYVENIGNAVESPKKIKILKQAQFINFREEAKEALTEWGTDRFDRIIFGRLTAGLTNVVYSDAGGVYSGITNGQAMTAADVLSVKDVEEAAKRARSGLDANGNSVPKLRPFRTVVEEVNGVKVKREIYVMQVGADSAANLKNDPEWISKQEAAASNGFNKTLFTGQLGVIDDTVLVQANTQTSEYAGILTSSDTTIDGVSLSGYAGGASGEFKTEINLFLGATAGLLPMDDGFEYYDEEIDMGRRAQFGIDRDFGFAKTHYVGTTAAEQATIYHQKDYGVIGVVSAIGA
ncbi:phage capsid family protein [Hydrogenimonas sp.]